MAPPAIGKRKRQRKRKRRNDISESSSSSSSSESDSDDQKLPPVSKPAPATKEDSDSSSSSSSSSSSEDEEAPISRGSHAVKDVEMHDSAQEQKSRNRRSPSPQPPKPILPTFLPSDANRSEEIEAQKAMKEKFKKFWMERIADGFKDDLEQIRKEPNLKSSRVSLLIDSLASGADIFSQGGNGKTDEMALVLEEKEVEDLTGI